MKKTLYTMLICCMLLSSCSMHNEPVQSDEMSMTFMAGYKPQANLPFVGVYVAQEMGYFEEEHLQVSIEHSAGNGEHLQLLAAGKVQVTTQDAGVLLKRRADPGLPLVSIALIGQHGQQAFASLTSSSIQTPQDWAGHSLGFKGSIPPDLIAMLHAAGLDENDVEIINVGFDPRLLTEGKVDVYPLYKSNEPYLIQSWGEEITLWEAADYDLPSMGLTYVTSEEILSENPEMLSRFLRAALKGIQYAESHIDETVQIVLKYSGPESNPDHMKFMLQMELSDAHSVFTEAEGLGWQTSEQWQQLADFLVEYDAMQPTDPEKAFTIDILQAAKP
ncbi:MAG: ABC transporter substrate-binding protein [Anaerolineaceae bacterium]|nr:ABC transporter substrate-binding protein [Anaerolineaceae bacterium]